MHEFPEVEAIRLANEAFAKGYANPVPYALPLREAARRFDDARRAMERDLEAAVAEALEGMAVRPEQVLPHMARYIQAGHPERALQLLAHALAQGTAVGERQRQCRIYALLTLIGFIGLSLSGVVVATVLRVWGVL